MQMKTKNGCYKTKETTTLKINKSETKKPQIIQKKVDVKKRKKQTNNRRD